MSLMHSPPTSTSIIGTGTKVVFTQRSVTTSVIPLTISHIPPLTTPSTDKTKRTSLTNHISTISRPKSAVYNETKYSTPWLKTATLTPLTMSQIRPAEVQSGTSLEIVTPSMKPNHTSLMMSSMQASTELSPASTIATQPATAMSLISPPVFPVSSFVSLDMTPPGTLSNLDVASPVWKTRSNSSEDEVPYCMLSSGVNHARGENCMQPSTSRRMLHPHQQQQSAMINHCCKPKVTCCSVSGSIDPCFDSRTEQQDCISLGCCEFSTNPNPSNCKTWISRNPENNENVAYYQQCYSENCSEATFLLTDIPSHEPSNNNQCTTAISPGQESSFHRRFSHAKNLKSDQTDVEGTIENPFVEKFIEATIIPSKGNTQDLTCDDRSHHKCRCRRGVHNYQKTSNKFHLDILKRRSISKIVSESFETANRRCPRNRSTRRLIQNGNKRDDDSTASDKGTASMAVSKLNPTIHLLQVIGLCTHCVNAAGVNQGWCYRIKTSILLLIALAAIVINSYVFFGYNMEWLMWFTQDFGMWDAQTIMFMLTGTKPIQCFINLVCLTFRRNKHRKLCTKLAELDAHFWDRYKISIPLTNMNWAMYSAAIAIIAVCMLLRVSQFLVVGEELGKSFMADASFLIIHLMGLWQLLPIWYFHCLNVAVRQWLRELKHVLALQRIQSNRCFDGPRAPSGVQLNPSQVRRETYFNIPAENYKLGTIVETYLKITDVIKGIDRVFNVFILFSVARTICCFCLTIYVITEASILFDIPPYVETAVKVDLSFHGAWSVLEVVLSIIYIFIISYSGMLTNSDARTFKNEVIYYPAVDDDERYEIFVLTQKVNSQCCWGISAWQTFPIESNFGVTLISGVLTFFFVLRKLRNDSLSTCGSEDYEDYDYT